MTSHFSLILQYLSQSYKKTKLSQTKLDFSSLALRYFHLERIILSPCEHSKCVKRISFKSLKLLHRKIYFLGTPSVNFINFLQAAFKHAESRSVKKTVMLSVFFRFWDLCLQQLCVNMLMKLTLVANAVKLICFFFQFSLLSLHAFLHQ